MINTRRKISNDTEFQTLRDEIINLQSMDTNTIIAMYTLSIAIIGIGIETENYLWLFLVYAVGMKNKPCKCNNP